LHEFGEKKDSSLPLGMTATLRTCHLEQRDLELTARLTVTELPVWIILGSVSGDTLMMAVPGSLD
jgi:hypothetical protein